MALITQPNMHLPGQAIGDLHTGDEFYEALLDAHQGLSEEQSHAFNARLILTLANHIGDVVVLKEAIKLAKDAG